ncbi:chloride channel protein CLC-e isoform X1 [Amborella trichopoda]|nr:chloride channel protein CLC-e isoform X1 [Amborella trichopoda]|eukprot:XP_020526242.1 chloride channel protein CLC-e isoform X1 [Amborella trichopoda]
MAITCLCTVPSLLTSPTMKVPYDSYGHYSESFSQIGFNRPLWLSSIRSPRILNRLCRIDLGFLCFSQLPEMGGGGFSNIDSDQNYLEIVDKKEGKSEGGGYNLEKMRDDEEDDKLGEFTLAFGEMIPPEGFAIISACFIGLLTGIGVVLFNNVVHEVRDFFWDGIPSRGASWLRETPLEENWKRVIFVPTCGGVMVGLLNILRNQLEEPSKGTLPSNVKASLKPFLKAVAASITLGTGNSLGPEGPSVEIGSSIGKGVAAVFQRSNERRLPLVAAGSAAGISSGFNAAVAGCFFAVESVLWPSPSDSSSSISNATSMVILSAVIASVVSEVGLGSVPAFRVPDYDFRSASELPLYLLLGVLCGLVSTALSKCTSYALAAVEAFQKNTAMSLAVFPIIGGMSVGLIALVYPEVLYWDFQNVDILLESRPFVNGLPADLLLQLVGAKIIATSLSRASGMVGGYYAPSLFIGAATGMAYGKYASYLITHSDPWFNLSILEVASPQAYGLVGMAATLAGVCQVPLTSVLLLFELTQDYRIVLPLLGAVGLSSWIASNLTRKKDNMTSKKEGFQAKAPSLETKSISSNQTLYADSDSGQVIPDLVVSTSTKVSSTSDLCELESSLCVEDFSSEVRNFEETISVAQAMRTRYISILMTTLLTETVSLMLVEKQPCALIVDNDDFLIGILTLGDIQQFCKSARASRQQAEVREIYHCNGGRYSKLWTATPSMTLFSAQRIMNKYDLNQLPVVSEHSESCKGGRLLGLLDRDCIHLACRALATKEILSNSPRAEGSNG